MMRSPPLAALFALPILLVACQAEEPREQTAQQHTNDVAKIEKAQDTHPPVQPLRPEAIEFADIDANGLAGAGCAFLVGEGDAAANMFLSDDQRGAFKLKGKMVILAADSGSPELPYLSRQRYTGRDMWVHVEQGPGEGVPYGDEAMRWQGSTLTAYDRWDRATYRAQGTLECGA